MPAQRPLFRSLNDLIVLLLVSLLLYRRISRQAREVRKIRHAYRRLFEELPVSMFIFDSRNFRFLAANTAATWPYGYSREEFLQLKITDIRPPEDVPAFLAAIGKVRTAMPMPGAGCIGKRTARHFMCTFFRFLKVFG